MSLTNILYKGDAMSIAKRIKAISEIRGEFVLRSGTVSDRYFDKYRFESDPELLSDITQNMVSLIPEDTEVLCGLEMGGIPVVTMLSHHSRLPAAFIRKAPKEYGTCKYAEGANLSGKRIILIEDVVSSGGAITDAARMLRNDGIEVNTALCVIDRETGGKEALKEQGIELFGLLTATDLV
jgi:orotate phosphoribosyltransferase